MQYQQSTPGLSNNVAKFKRPRVHDDQKISKDNNKFKHGCPPDYPGCCPDYQSFGERIDPKIVILTNL